MRTVVGSAPGRVNLIGEHLDYNGGRCLPMALPQRTRATVGRSEGPVTHDSAYVRGVLSALEVRDDLSVSIASDVPIGVGLSSSAALLCAVAVAVDELLQLHRSPKDLVAACVLAETSYVGAPTGGLDQTASMLCTQGHALLVDFANGSADQVPFLPSADGVELVVIDTRVTHAHSTGEYGERRAQCEEAARRLGLELLVQADAGSAAVLPEPLARRARHVLSEQRRVDAFVTAAGAGDWAEAGRLMTASHASLRDDYEVSCPELDTAVDAALAAGALGARMTGGGFGGCAIALVPRDVRDSLAAGVYAAFSAHTWDAPTVFTVEASRGASVP